MKVALIFILLAVVAYGRPLYDNLGEMFRDDNTKLSDKDENILKSLIHYYDKMDRTASSRTSTAAELSGWHAFFKALVAVMKRHNSPSGRRPGPSLKGGKITHSHLIGIDSPP
jgi:hypothetical protein